MSLALATWSSILGPVRPRLGDTVLFSIRRPWRMWIAFVLIAAARLAIARRSPLDVGPRLRRMSDAVRRWAAINRRNDALAYVAITLVSVWLAAGPPARLWTLVYWLPGFNFIRVPSRFMLLAVLGLAVLAGIGFDRLTARLAMPRRRALATIAGIGLVAEFSAVPLGTEAYRVDIPAIDRWLASQPTPFVVAELPEGGERLHTEYMLHSTAHWQKTIEGYSGFRPPLHEQLYRELARFPDDTTLERLRQIGVNYIVVHTDLYSPQEWPTVERRLTAFQDRLALMHVEGAGRVYAIRPR
jgi:hypothetical protein